MEWDDWFQIKVTLINPGTVHILANEAGLRSLARLLLTLANDKAPNGSHWHLDPPNSLEEGSIELIIEKNEL
jgi:hypothetical protein